MNGFSDERELWENLRVCPTDAVRQMLFFRYVPWSRSIARDIFRRLRVPQMEWNDYVQNASIGLLEAMGRFDETRGIDFMAYAKARVRGAVFNGVRSFLADNARRASPNARLIERLDSLADGDQDDLLQQMIDVVSGLGIGLLLASNDMVNGDFSGAGDASVVAEQSQLERQLDASLARLPERERLVLTLHYHQHVPFVEISRMLGVTKGRISQLHKSGIERCRSLIREAERLVEA